MKHPLLAVVSTYAGGLLLAETFQPPLALLFAISFLILAVALMHKRLRPFFIWLLQVLAGWVNLVSQTAVISPNNLRIQVGTEPMLATVRGSLMEMPNLKIYERDGEHTERTLTMVHVRDIRCGEAWRPAWGAILVATSGLPDGNFFADHPVRHHDDHHHRRLVAETAQSIDQLPRRRRVHHSALRPAATVLGQIPAFLLRRVEHRGLHAAHETPP